MSRGSRDPKRNPQGRPGERRACSRKTRYSKLGAELQVSRYGGSTYKCPYCSGWHTTKGK